ncbi:hypothetical protein GQ43DRAFT_464956 [Delitschia confertaspora ATCC 74209]|uniref:Uncharacterized protein n=1 Tax=Delitschia confertaspora ATCC 74209 TaxID=1513339 RepID=A0A9P4JH14_9PLEO|nr:hypothetical protein GQ43DRAFT_464956 [Delitschia confertaspora ATCC 74209]
MSSLSESSPSTSTPTLVTTATTSVSKPSSSVCTPNTSPPSSPTFNIGRPTFYLDDQEENAVSVNPCALLAIPSETNGALLNEREQGIRTRFKTVQKSAATVAQKAAFVDVGRILGEVSEKLVDQVNQACEGYDVVEMYNTVQSKIPNMELSDKRQLERLFDRMTDRVQSLWPRSLRAPGLRGGAGEVSQAKFVWIMGRNARHALVKERICDGVFAMASRPNIKWQEDMKMALRKHYTAIKEGRSFDELTSMIPLWIPLVDKNVWGLVLKEKEIDEPESLIPIFEIPTQEGWVSVCEYTGGTSTGHEDYRWETEEEEWENMDDESEDPSFGEDSAQCAEDAKVDEDGFVEVSLNP